jgi:glycosyltransferase involved in cell wall biosynthesis
VGDSMSTFAIFQSDQHAHFNTQFMHSVSIITRLKNRKEHIVQTLPTWLTKPIKEIVIVDCGSEDGDIQQYINYLDDERIKVVKFHHDDFNRGSAWNAGILESTQPWVLTLDADMLLKHDPIFDVMIKLDNYNNFYIPKNDWNAFTKSDNPPALYGICLINKYQWAAVGGFNEHLSGWGWEDIDLYDRLREATYRDVYTTPHPYEHIWHPDHQRTDNHKAKDVRVTLVANAIRCNYHNAEKLIRSEAFKELALRYGAYTREYDIRRFIGSKDLQRLATSVGACKRESLINPIAVRNLIKRIKAKKELQNAG